MHSDEAKEADEGKPEAKQEEEYDVDYDRYLPIQMHNCIVEEQQRFAAEQMAMAANMAYIRPEIYPPPYYDQVYPTANPATQPSYPAPGYYYPQASISSNTTNVRPPYYPQENLQYRYPPYQ